MAYTKRAEEAVVERLSMQAKRYDRQYKTAPELLQLSVRNAMPWAMQLVRGQMPPLDALETLGAQLFAILVASEEDALKRQQELENRPE